MFRYMSTIALILWVTTSTAAIQNSDFWFHDDGDTIFIDGKRGAPLHIDYIGGTRTKPLTVKVTPDNTELKVSPSTCTFTKKDDECRLTVYNAKPGDKVYGVNQFTVKEVGASQGVLTAQAASDTSNVGFGVGIQGKDMPAIIPWQGDQFNSGPGRVVVVNSTGQTRDYRTVLWDRDPVKSRWDAYSPKKITTPIFSLPSGRICYIDQDLFFSPDPQLLLYPFNIIQNAYMSYPGWISDITDPSDPIYNGPYYTGNNNITTCSANGINWCASNKWDSWTLGLANLTSEDLDSNVFKAGQIQILQNNTWDNGTTLYYKNAYKSSGWTFKNIALLLIQGSIDGSSFDPNAASPNINEIKSAPPCSNYFKIDQTTYTVRLKIYGPGIVTMPAGAQCQTFNLPGESFTNCIGSGFKDAWYKITAVPEAGKTFKGWGSDGLCDDTQTTCWIPLTQNVSMRPYFW